MIPIAHASHPDIAEALGVPCRVSRRGFALALGGAAITAIGLPGGTAGAVVTAARRPVIGFHADAPWLDPSGRDLPYVPPHAAFGTVPDDISLAGLGHFL